MKLEELQERIARPEFSIIDCVRATGLHHNTLYRIARGEAKRLMPLTHRELVKYINKLDREAASNEA